jgi:hypothetical protein
MLIVRSMWDAQKETKNETRCYLDNFLLMCDFSDSYFAYNRNYVQILMYAFVHVWIITYRILTTIKFLSLLVISTDEKLYRPALAHHSP